MARTWRVPKAFVVVLLLGVVAWAVPSSSTGIARFDCGPAITAVFGIARPANPNRFIPAQPGGDTGTVASQSCQMRSALPVFFGGIAVVVGAFGVAAAWGDRRKHPILVLP